MIRNALTHFQMLQRVIGDTPAWEPLNERFHKDIIDTFNKMFLAPPAKETSSWCRGQRGEMTRIYSMLRLLQWFYFRSELTPWTRSVFCFCFCFETNSTYQVHKLVLSTSTFSCGQWTVLGWLEKYRKPEILEEYKCI